MFVILATWPAFFFHFLFTDISMERGILPEEKVYEELLDQIWQAIE